MLLRSVLSIAIYLCLSTQAVFAEPALHGSLFGRVMCGYQGWFATPSDGTGLGWQHYGFEKPGQCAIDLWPDVSEYDPEERIKTPLKYADGTPAFVFSSAHAKTTQRHFEWMQQYGIHGIFLQRFGTSLRDARSRAQCDQVLANVRQAAESTGRSFCIMYDLTGLKAGEIESVVMQDWKRLRQELKILESSAYQHHVGKPLVAVWGVGFSDRREYRLEECQELLRFLHDNPEFGQLTVMAGVPWGWRTLSGDATANSKLHEVLISADLISPWSVGRYPSSQMATQMIQEVHVADVAWCHQRGKEYLPVIFPGFSWANLSKYRGEQAPLNQIPRQGGEFLWLQARFRIRAGSSMLYVAMFDELDEGTAIFKTTARVPVGTVGFVTEPELPADHYLWLTGQIGRALRREIAMDEALPTRE